MRFRRRRRPSSVDAETVRTYGRRPEVDSDPQAGLILEHIRRIEWSKYSHAYGTAEDVRALLEALALGDDPTRSAAWWELWGNVHHQGTVYPATVPATDVLAELAAWKSFPDRRESLCMLTAFAEGDGTSAVQVEEGVRVRAIDLAAGWREEPELVQRGLLMLTRSAGLDDHAVHDHVLPERFDKVWALGTRRDIWARFGDEEPVDEAARRNFDAAMDALEDLENWAFSEQ